MEFSQYTWDLYKQSDKGKKAIVFFKASYLFFNDIEAINRYNPNHGKWIDKREYNNERDNLEWGIIQDDDGHYPREFNYSNFSEVREFYEKILEEGVFYILDDEKKYVIYPQEYKYFLKVNVILSFMFYQIANDYCIPNIFIYRFFDLNKIADAFNIDIPEIPKKSDYKARCMYYMDLCEVLYNFRIKNNLSPEELCAFLYDFAPNFIKKESGEIPKPAQAWFIGGLRGSEDEGDFWQANPETKKGDILVHYETSPISAITHIWRAKTDGVKDPFFYYYSNSYITKGIKVPNITLKELREDEYFSKNSLVRKSFQGVNGWSMSNEDYFQLLRIFKDKDFDTKILPVPYAPDTPKSVIIKKEEDVESKLLEFYLNEMELEKGRDYIKQLPIKAGRGNRIYPDYALHYNDKEGYERAKIIIEAKLQMKNNKEIEDAFKQARSYANLLESSVIILCDKHMLLIYRKKESFDRDDYIRMYWEDLKNPDNYKILKEILSNKN